MSMTIKGVTSAAKKGLVYARPTIQTIQNSPSKAKTMGGLGAVAGAAYLGAKAIKNAKKKFDTEQDKYTADTLKRGDNLIAAARAQRPRLQEKRKREKAKDLEYLNKYNDDYYNCKKCSFEGIADDWQYDDVTNELICPDCGNKIKL
jgi:DNA-directed RNA polymerase subunit RPC12/RpoP